MWIADQAFYPQGEGARGPQEESLAFLEMDWVARKQSFSTWSPSSVLPLMCIPDLALRVMKLLVTPAHFSLVDAILILTTLIGPDSRQIIHVFLLLSCPMPRHDWARK